MANNIVPAKRYTALLDEVYKNAAYTSVLDSDPSLSRAGANVNEIVIPKISMDGLADYDRASGYVTGDVSLEWETKKFNYERGRMFTVDNMDNEETQGLAFGRLAGEFIRTKAVPELDAFRMAYYSSIPGIDKKEETLTSGEGIVSSIRASVAAMDESEVPNTGRFLFITPTLKGILEDMDTFKSKMVMESFDRIVAIPQTRFYTAVSLLNGKSGDEKSGGYKKAEGASNINFMAIHKEAIIQFTKHAVPKVIPPEQNQSADAWKYGYRIYGMTSYFENKVAGLYCSYAPAGT